MTYHDKQGNKLHLRLLAQLPGGLLYCRVANSKRRVVVHRDHVENEIGDKQILSLDMIPAHFADVEEFHEHFDIEYYGPTRRLPNDLQEFRFARLQEELNEYYDAANAVDMLDALIDLVYIVYGTAHLHGITAEAWNEAWRRVHEANMKKERVKNASESKHLHQADIKKPEGWQPPYLEDLV